MNPHQSETETIHTDPSAKSELYYVMAADIAVFSSGHPTFACFHCIVTRATDSFEAMRYAIAACEDGYTPLVSFNAADLHGMLNLLPTYKVKDGEAFNRTTSWKGPFDP
jgi:hypothetical protein